jgi:hypothetical protein
MNFGFRAEVGYDAAKNVTYLKTNTPDFTEQLTIPVRRGSKEDGAIRSLLNEQGIVDFAELAKVPRLPDFLHNTFGLVGTEEDTNLTMHVHDQVVLFGKEGSGVTNLIRYWILNAAAHNIHIAAVGTPHGLYGMGHHVNSNLLHILDEEEPLEEQVGEILNGYNRNLLIIIGEDYEPLTDEDAEFIMNVQNHEYNDEENIYTLIHHAPLSELPIRESFLGDEGDEENITFITVGDVTNATVELMGDYVTARNRRGIAWVKKGADDATRVRTFYVPREFCQKLEGRVAYI